MFGGYGIYYQDLMIALVAEDVLYLKADEDSVSAFTEKGLKPFVYEKNAKVTRMSYYLAPETIFENLNEAKAWGTLAYEAALRAQSKRRPKKRKNSSQR
jgi:DNA transformation protein